MSLLLLLVIVVELLSLLSSLLLSFFCCFVLLFLNCCFRSLQNIIIHYKFINLFELYPPQFRTYLFLRGNSPATMTSQEQDCRPPILWTIFSSATISNSNERLLVIVIILWPGRYKENLFTLDSSILRITHIIYWRLFQFCDMSVSCQKHTIISHMTHDLTRHLHHLRRPCRQRHRHFNTIWFMQYSHRARFTNMEIVMQTICLQWHIRSVLSQRLFTEISRINHGNSTRRNVHPTCKDGQLFAVNGTPSLTSSTPGILMRRLHDPTGWTNCRPNFRPDSWTNVYTVKLLIQPVGTIIE